VKRRLNATEDDGRIAAVAELRPAALNDLDDVYHYITTLQAPNAVRARIRKKLLKLWITVRQTNRFGEKGNRTAKAPSAP
jgi:plasmid stabilization system protein ParE